MKKKLRVVISKRHPRVLAWRDLISSKPQGLLFDVLACCLQYAASFHEYPMIGCVSLSHMRECVKDEKRYDAIINTDVDTDMGKKICLLHEMGASSKLLSILENCIKVAEPGEEEWVCDRDYVMQLSVDAVMGEHISGNPSINPMTYSYFTREELLSGELTGDSSVSTAEQKREPADTVSSLDKKKYITDGYSDDEYMDYIMSGKVSMDELRDLLSHESAVGNKARANRVELAIQMFGLV